jgi:hypothetical protein
MKLPSIGDANMNCYFCQEKVYLQASHFQYACHFCQNKYQLSRVLTTSQHKDDEVVQYAHIFHDTPQKIYHVRLHIFENYTNIAIIKPDNSNYVTPCALQLPGYPLTPANVKTKVTLYLLFS